VDTTEEILALCREILSGTVGNEIECSWVAWDKEDEWDEHAPVILRIGGVNYEFCWAKDRDLAITCNCIDVAQPFNFYNHIELPMIWKKDRLPILREAIGHTITGVRVQECQNTIENASVPPEIRQFWLANSIDFSFGHSFLSIYNAFDANGITDKNEVWCQQSRVFDI
jgi:hypothetical protein